MALQIVKATESHAVGAQLPELVLILRDTEPTPERRGFQFYAMDELLDKGTWHRGAETNEYDRAYGQVIYANDGVFYTARGVRFDPKGKYTVQGDDGTRWTYSWFTWLDPSHVPDVGELVKVHCRAQDTGNIQYGLVPRSLVEAAIRESNLPFAIEHRQIVFTGPKEVIRESQLYPNCNGLTWGVSFRWQAFACADRREEWGGALWPDKATADAVAAKYVKDGVKDICANLSTLKERFPGNPVIAKVEAYEAERAKKAGR